MSAFWFYTASLSVTARYIFKGVKKEFFDSIAFAFAENVLEHFLWFIFPGELFFSTCYYCANS